MHAAGQGHLSFAQAQALTGQVDRHQRRRARGVYGQARAGGQIARRREAAAEHRAHVREILGNGVLVHGVRIHLRHRVTKFRHRPELLDRQGGGRIGSEHAFG